MATRDATVRQYLAGFFLFATVLGVFPWVLPLGLYPHTVTSPAAAEVSAPVIVIDPGHGGEDGGAVTPDGMTEKELNLLLAESVAELLSLSGYDVRLTREDDRLLYDRYGDLTDYTGQKKVYDLRNRLRFAEEAGAALLVSIHMNTFPDPSCRGLQVYYAPDDALSYAAAEAVQSTARTYLQPQNNRKTKAAPSSIYLLRRAKMPAILVECGFLSSEADRANLASAEGRLSLACAIATAVAGVVE